MSSFKDVLELFDHDAVGVAWQRYQQVEPELVDASPRIRDAMQELYDAARARDGREEIHIILSTPDARPGDLGRAIINAHQAMMEVAG